MARIHLIAGARPNFMKIAPLYHEIVKRYHDTVYVIHTGQHYDDAMSSSFFRDLNLPYPDFHLGTGGKTHAEQTARVMVSYEQLCFENVPDLVVVVGDVNSTLACTITAKKLCLQVAHLEAGLRSYDRTMPEEINRVVTDSISDILWTPSSDAVHNLVAEGIPSERIFFVGNIMIDSYEMISSKIDEYFSILQATLPSDYILLTLHRPSNVDNIERLSLILDNVISASKVMPIVFPVHPRTRFRLSEFGLLSRIEEEASINIIDPLGYIPFMGVLKNSRAVLTDSGGVQEETTYLGIPCLTLRNSTERPITVTHGTNRLIAPGEITPCITSILNGEWNSGQPLELWDGKTASRICDQLAALFA